jgi:hypothetical protein
MNKARRKELTRGNMRELQEPWICDFKGGKVRFFPLEDGKDPRPFCTSPRPCKRLVRGFDFF